MRPIVEEFANVMEDVLKENDHKGGWDNMDIEALLFRLKEEVVELEDELQNAWGFDTAAIRSEAADVANFAMFIYDKFGRVNDPEDFKGD